MSPPIWPFRKKQPEEEPMPESKVIEYGVSDESSAEKILDDRSHLEDESYKSAMDKLLASSSNVDDVSNDRTDEVESPTVEIEDDTSVVEQESLEPDGEWVENEQDGYWYRKMPDGNWDPQAYVKSETGEFEPYS